MNQSIHRCNKQCYTGITPGNANEEPEGERDNLTVWRDSMAVILEGDLSLRPT